MTDYYQYPAAQQPASGPVFADLETRAATHEHSELRLWLRLLSCCTLIENELRSRLRTEFKTTLPRFDLMSQLTHAPQGLKMSELSRLLMVTNGNITGITDQLEKDGMVERVRDQADRRSSLIRLTATGRRQFQRMQRAHESWLRSLLGGLDSEARNTLFNLLGDLKQVTHSRLPAM